MGLIVITAIIKYHISIFKNTGDFEIFEAGDLVVKGKIFEIENDLAEDNFCLENVNYMLTDEDFYTIKDILGFDFKGQFRSVKRSNYESEIF